MQYLCIYVFMLIYLLNNNSPNKFFDIKYALQATKVYGFIIYSGSGCCFVDTVFVNSLL